MWPSCTCHCCRSHGIHCHACTILLVSEPGQARVARSRGFPDHTSSGREGRGAGLEIKAWVVGTEEEVPVCCSGAPGEALTSLSQKVSYLLLGDSGHIHYFLELCENLGSSVLGYCHTLIGEEGQVGNIGKRGSSEPRVHSVTPWHQGDRGQLEAQTEDFWVDPLCHLGKILSLYLLDFFSSSFSRFSPSGTPIARMLDLWSAFTYLLCSVLFPFHFQLGNFPFTCI